VAVPELPLFIAKGAPTLEHLIAYDLGGVTQEVEGGYVVRYGGDRVNVVSARQNLVGSLVSRTLVDIASVPIISSGNESVI